MRLALFIYPMLIALLLFAIFYGESIRKLPVGVVDLDHSTTSQKIINYLNTVPEINLENKHRYTDLHLAKEALQNSSIYGLIYIPPYFEQNMLSGQSPEFTTFYNNQYMTVGGTLNRVISTALSSILVDIQITKMTANGQPFKLAMLQVSPISLVLHPLFNPTLNFIFSLANGVYPVIIQILLMMIVTASMQSYWKDNDGFIQYCTHHTHVFRSIFLVKIPIYLMLFLFYFVLFDSILVFHFDFTIAGHYLFMILGTILFIIATVSISIMFSLLLPDKMRNYGVIGILASPAFGFTGLMFPHIAMNGFAHFWASIIPLNWFMDIRLNCMVRGADVFSYLTAFIALLLMIFVPLLISYLRVNSVAKKYNRLQESARA